MKKLSIFFIFYSILIGFSPNISNSQNILENPDFEGGTPGYPTNFNQFNHLYDWEQMDRQDWLHWFGTTRPDWFGPNYNLTPFTQAQSGTHYVGSYDCQGGCQDLGDDLKEGSFVRFSFYHDARQGQQFARFYLAKKNLVIRSNCSGISLGWFGAQKIQLLGEVYISHTPNIDWEYFQSGYIAVNNDCYDWFGFKGGETYLEPDGSNQLDVPYSLFDNFTLENVDCLPSCESTSGDIQPAHSGIHDVQQPWFLYNLDNVSSSTVQIFSVNAGSVIKTFTVNSVNGITQPLYWDGKNGSGTEALAGPYIAMCTLSNSCETVESNFQFSKINGTINWTDPVTVTVYNNTGIHTPRPCCQQNITLSNMTIHGPGRLDFKVNGIIYLGPNLTFASDCVDEILLQAGGGVINNGYIVENGAKVTILHEPCAQRITEENLILHANFAIDQSNLCTNDTVKFYNTTQNAYPPVTYLWNFGNGNTSTEAEPEFVFGSADSFNVWLKVTDSLGRIDSISHPVIINDCIDTIGRDAIVLECPVDTITINDFADDSLYQSFVWDFGNGDSSTSREPIIYYSSPGVYTMKIVVTDTLGNKDSAYQKIVVPDCNTLRESQNNLPTPGKNSLHYSIVPNPSSGIFNFYFIKSDNEPEISIYDMTGRMIMQLSDIKENFLKLDLTSYSKGAYVTKIKIGEKTYFDKIILN